MGYVLRYVFHTTKHTAIDGGYGGILILINVKCLFM